MQSEKLALMESMKQELEDKIRKLEEDKQNMDISAGKIIVLSYYFLFISIGLTTTKKIKIQELILLSVYPREARWP